MRFAGLRSI